MLINQSPGAKLKKAPANVKANWNLGHRPTEVVAIGRNAILEFCNKKICIVIELAERHQF